MKRWILALLLGMGQASAQLTAPVNTSDLTSLEPASIQRLLTLNGSSGPEASFFQFAFRNDGGRLLGNGNLAIRLRMSGVDLSYTTVQECQDTAFGSSRPTNYVEESFPIQMEVTIFRADGQMRDTAPIITDSVRLCDDVARLVSSPPEAGLSLQLEPGEVIFVRARVFPTYGGFGYQGARPAFNLQLLGSTDLGTAATPVSVQEIFPLWPKMKVGAVFQSCFDEACSAQFVNQVFESSSLVAQAQLQYGSGQSFLLGGIMLPPVGESRRNAQMRFSVPLSSSGCDGYGLGGLAGEIVGRRGTGPWVPFASLMPLMPGDLVTFGADANADGSVSDADVLQDGTFASLGVRCRGPLLGGQTLPALTVTRDDSRAPLSSMVYW